MPGVVVRLRDGADVDAFARGRASPADRFRVGSITKTFVAVLALKLADAGALRLDDPVSRHVPGLLRDGDRVTIRDLLDHTAGLYDYTQDPELLNGELSPRALVAIADRRPRSTGYAYSSTNYLALGLVLEAAGKRRSRRSSADTSSSPSASRETTFEPGARLRRPPPRAHARVARRHRHRAPPGHRRPVGPLGLGRRCRVSRRRPISTASSRGSWEGSSAPACGRRATTATASASRASRRLRRRRRPHGQPPRDDLGRRSARRPAPGRRRERLSARPRPQERAFQRLLDRALCELGPVRCRPAATTVCRCRCRDARTGSPD